MIRDQTVAAAVTESDRKLIELAADQREESVSNFLRQTAMTAAREEVAGGGRENDEADN